MNRFYPGRKLFGLAVLMVFCCLSKISFAQPGNDNCSNATSISSATTCTTTAGSLKNATASSPTIASCVNTSFTDVWYTFQATSPYPTITLSSFGSNFTSPTIQLLQGNCSGFTSLGCVSGTSFNVASVVGGLGLTVGDTYYIRILSGATTSTNGGGSDRWSFRICITDPVSTATNVDYGKSYVNITKGTNGGTIEPGDELEIRATFVITSGSVTVASFNDMLPSNTSYVPGTLRILTNEGKIYKQWTDAIGDDPAEVNGSNVKINLGTGATSSSGGTVSNTDKPSLWGSTCILMASYHVKVNTVAYGSIVTVGGGVLNFIQSGSNVLLKFPTVNAVVYQSFGICSNTVGSNGILSEFGGTFGTGNTKDRAASTKVPANYTYSAFSNGSPADYKYGISNNSSSDIGTNYSIDPSEPYNSKRVFGVWDVIGDHTGATDPLQGNWAADVKNGASGGYMVVINAAYRTDTAFLDTIKNLCPNTSYEYSAWFRNICRRCGGDVNGVGSNAASGYIPTGPGDSSGVRPNLSFNINGYDYYTTGDIAYTGKWVKKGFTYRTGANETQMIISVRNNAPGGGGNDWAIDDINVATCTPNLTILPGPTTNICYGNQIDIYSEVKSYYDNYRYAQWEKSTDGGATWISTGVTDVLNYTWNGTEYVDTTYYPSFVGDSASHMNMYRVRIASSPDNLNSATCSFLATTTIVIYVNNCSEILNTKILNVTGRVKDGYGEISWTTENETADTKYVIEKSTDKIRYKAVGYLNGKYGNAKGGNYSLTDAELLTQQTYYRIRVLENNNAKYSKVITLNNDKLAFGIKNLENPFRTDINFEISSPTDGNAIISLTDGYGRMIKTQNVHVVNGVNNIQIGNLSAITSGNYILRVQMNGEIVNKKLIKLSN